MHDAHLSARTVLLYSSATSARRGACLLIWGSMQDNRSWKLRWQLWCRYQLPQLVDHHHATIRDRPYRLGIATRWYQGRPPSAFFDFRPALQTTEGALGILPQLLGSEQKQVGSTVSGLSIPKEACLRLAWSWSNELRRSLACQRIFQRQGHPWHQSYSS